MKWISNKFKREHYFKSTLLKLYFVHLDYSKYYFIKTWENPNLKGWMDEAHHVKLAPEKRN